MNNYNERRVGREKRQSLHLPTRPQRWLIVTEGTKTEPNYFKALIAYYNEKFGKKIILTVKGTGANTESLVKKAEVFVNEVSELRTDTRILYTETFTVFDKDSFSDEQFDKAIMRSDANGYITLWSNECFELWFVLHFQLIESKISRTKYFEMLSKQFKKKYYKNDNHFMMLGFTQNIESAVNNAKYLVDKFQNEPSCAKKLPCTMVYLIIEEIKKIYKL